MPLIRVQLSVAMDDETRSHVMAKLSSTVAGTLGKPESYVMVVLEPDTAMLMGGDGAPAALVEVRSVGTISGGHASKLSGAISAILAEAGIDASRVYSNFTGVPGAMWGMGDSTFG